MGAVIRHGGGGKPPDVNFFVGEAKVAGSHDRAGILKLKTFFVMHEGGIPALGLPIVNIGTRITIELYNGSAAEVAFSFTLQGLEQVPRSGA